MINGRVAVGMDIDMKDSCWKNAAVFTNPLCGSATMIKTSEILHMEDLKADITTLDNNSQTTSAPFKFIHKITLN